MHAQPLHDVGAVRSAALDPHPHATPACADPLCRSLGDTAARHRRAPGGARRNEGRAHDRNAQWGLGARAARLSRPTRCHQAACRPHSTSAAIARKRAHRGRAWVSQGHGRRPAKTWPPLPRCGGERRAPTDKGGERRTWCPWLARSSWPQLRTLGRGHEERIEATQGWPTWEARELREHGADATSLGDRRCMVRRDDYRLHEQAAAECIGLAEDLNHLMAAPAEDVLCRHYQIRLSLANSERPTKLRTKLWKHFETRLLAERAALGQAREATRRLAEHLVAVTAEDDSLRMAIDSRDLQASGALYILGGLALLRACTHIPNVAQWQALAWALSSKPPLNWQAYSTCNMSAHSWRLIHGFIRCAVASCLLSPSSLWHIYHLSSLRLSSLRASIANRPSPFLASLFLASALVSVAMGDARSRWGSTEPLRVSRSRAGELSTKALRATRRLILCERAAAWERHVRQAGKCSRNGWTFLMPSRTTGATCGVSHN